MEIKIEPKGDIEFIVKLSNYERQDIAKVLERDFDKIIDISSTTGFDEFLKELKKIL